jgi:hypothetical protein
MDWSHFVHPQRFSGYVREIERHKSRNDCASYEAEYIAESVEWEPPVGVPFADLYLVGQRWPEVEVVFVRFGHAYLNCVFLVELLRADSGNLGDEDIDSSGVDRDYFVLFEITEFIQLPKRMSLRHARSLMRLHTVNLSPNIIRESSQGVGIAAPSIAITEVFGNREVDFFRVIWPGYGLGHLPSHLVETRTETVQEFSELQPQYGVESFQFNPFDVASVLRVVLGNDSVWFFHVGGHIPVESVKVKLCPLRLFDEIPRGTRNHFSPL